MKSNNITKPFKCPVNCRRKMALFLLRSQLSAYKIALENNETVSFRTKAKIEDYPKQIKRIEKEIAAVISKIVS